MARQAQYNAEFNARFGKKKTRRKKAVITMGKMFTTKRGKYGCYKYVNGKRVAFVTQRRRRKKN